MGIDNWIGWLQARIPELKKSHNAFWVKQALEGYSLEAEKKALNTSNVVGQSEQLVCEGCKKEMNSGLCGSCCSDLASGNY